MNTFVRKNVKSLYSLNASTMSFNRCVRGLGNLGSDTGAEGGGGGSSSDTGGVMDKRKQRDQLNKLKQEIDFQKQKIEKHIEEMNKAKAKLLDK